MHDNFQNSLSGLAEISYNFLYERNKKKTYLYYNIKYK